MIVVKEKNYYTNIDAAKKLGISVNTLKKYINRGIIPKPPQVIQGCRIMNHFPSKYISNVKSHLQKYRDTNRNRCIKTEKIHDEKVSKKIIKIIGRMKCSKDFKCANNGFKSLCRAKDCGMDYYLECLEQNPLACKFVILFGDQYYCQCPLRVYIAKHLGK